MVFTAAAPVIEMGSNVVVVEKVVHKTTDGAPVFVSSSR